ncbi:MAG: hypothetical protein JXB14_03115 [Candidatus Altiarchaeota archaeon]|nr:hypothetical protein [Candidatus Altiarchaeota archaeon]
MKKRISQKPRKFFKNTLLVTGVSLNKTLDVFIPPKIIHESSFFAGLRRFGDAMTNMGKGDKKSRSAGKDYVVRKTGGIAADVSLGVLTLGVPITLVSSIFSDGCKVISKIMDGAVTDDKNVIHLSLFFQKASIISNNFMVLFDIPSKKTAHETRESIQDLILSLKKSEGGIPESVLNELEELKKLAVDYVEDREKWMKEVQSHLSRFALEQLKEVEDVPDRVEIQEFIEDPTIEGLIKAKDGLMKSFVKRNISIAESPKRHVEELCQSLESFSSERFFSRMRGFMLKQYRINEKTKEAVNDGVYNSFQILESTFKTFGRGATLFGSHYWKQISGLFTKGND